MSRTVTIDAFPDSAYRHLNRSAIVCVDVLSYTTAAVTAAGAGRRVFMAASNQEAERLLLAVPGSPVLAGNSHRTSLQALNTPDEPSPVILTERPCSVLLANCQQAKALYVSCLRNITATAEWLSSRYDDIAIIGAGQGFDFRCEDRIGAGYLAREFVAKGFSLMGQGTAQLVKYWGSADPKLIHLSRSARDARRSGHAGDIDFVQHHIDDLDVVCQCRGNEILPTIRKLGSVSFRPEPTASAVKESRH